MKFLQSLLTYSLLIIILFVLQSCSQSQEETAADEKKEVFSVIIGGTQVGDLVVSHASDTLSVDYEYSNNGRGPTIKESIILGPDGFPKAWSISGNTTFGNQINEEFRVDDDLARWTDATGSGSAAVDRSSIYVPQAGSPYAIGLIAKSLMNHPEFTLSALPSGNLQLEEIEAVELDSGDVRIATYAISGADLNPDYFILDENRELFAYITPRFIVVREGFENQEKELRQLSEKYAAERFTKIHETYAHNYEGDVRVTNVRIFDPMTLELTSPKSILVSGQKIVSIDGPNASGDNEVVIDGNGGTVVAGLYDMHAHMGQNAALFNVLAGVTSVRDMGNNNEVLDSLIMKIESGELAGPRITRLGFIEGKSEFNSNNGILVSSEEEAVKAVETYAEKQFYGIKSYNSMKGEWAPALVKRAHELGMPVTGHVPAFSNANAMIRAGFDELTHINQVMLGWVLEQGEDTRTLLRLTALKRLPDLDLNSDKVQETIDLMVENEVVMDPTLAIHELLLLAQNGETRIGVLDYYENMPPAVQRNYKIAPAKMEGEEEIQAYRGAYEKIVKTLQIMRDRGIMLVPGTDLGGAFNLHRELELYQGLGYTPAELLKLASYDMAEYLGHEDRGSLKPGMLADFFLIPGNPVDDIKAIKTISMVMRGGVVYYPTEFYPSFGIKPFTEVPDVQMN